MTENRRAIRPGMRCMHRRRRAHVDASAFKDARLIAGFTRKVAAESIGVSERTIRNWEARRVGVPYSAFKLMRILSGYSLPGTAWAGFMLRGDTLWSPEGKAFSAHDLAWWSLTCAMARAFRRLHARSGAQTEAVDRPPSLPVDGVAGVPLAAGSGGVSTPAQSVGGVSMSLGESVGASGARVARAEIAPS